MRCTRLVYVIAVMALGSAAGAAAQAARPVPLAEPLRAHLKGERFDVVTSIRGLPLGVRNELQTLWRSQTLDIAEPGTAFQGNAAIPNPALPARRLIAAGCSPDFHCLVYYERGGRTHTWLVALFRWTPSATRLEWGGTAPSGLASLEDIRTAALSGSVSVNELW